MSQAAYEALMKAKNDVLRDQRDCAWCGFHAFDSDELADHITEHHANQDKGKQP